MRVCDGRVVISAVLETAVLLHAFQPGPGLGITVPDAEALRLVLTRALGQRLPSNSPPQRYS